MRGKKQALCAAVFTMLLFALPVGAADMQVSALSAENTRLEDGHMASMVKNGKPLDRLISYTPESPAFYAVAKLLSAPPDTKIRFSWFFVSQNQHVADIELTNGNHGSDIYVYSTLTNNDNPWPQGSFKVEMFVGDRKEPDQIVDFDVE